MSSLYIEVIFKTIILEEEASLLAQLVKNLPAVQETWDQSLGWEDPLEKGLSAEAFRAEVAACSVQIGELIARHNNKNAGVRLGELIDFPKGEY